MDPVYQVPTLVQYDVLWAKAASRVFLGSGFPHAAATSAAADDPPHETNEAASATRVLTITTHPGGLAAASLSSPLTSVPVPGVSSTSASTSSDPSSCGQHPVEAEEAEAACREA